MTTVAVLLTIGGPVATRLADAGRHRLTGGYRRRKQPMRSPASRSRPLARADERGGRDVTVEVDLDDVVLAEAARIRSLTQLSVTTAIEPARVLGDPHALRRLTRNLTDNARHRAAHRRR